MRPRLVTTAPERSADKPGPGPVPPQVLRSLDLAVMKRIESLVPGEHLTPQTGSGTELAMIRPYHPGDDVRHIDWNATARLQEPHVRVHVGERALTTWLVLDVSASMAFGTADRRKVDVAEGVALAVGHVATRRGNRLGVLAFGGAEPRILRPRQGRLGLLALLAELRRESEEGAGATSLGSALGSAAALGRQRGLVVIVSDFRGEHDWEAPLRALRARHGVMAVEIVDPREQELVSAGDLWLVDPETGRQIHVDTRRRKVRDRFKAAAAAGARRGPPRPAAPRAPTTSSSRPPATGCAPSPRTCAAARPHCAPARPRARRFGIGSRPGSRHEFRGTDPARRVHPRPARDPRLRLAAAAPQARLGGVGQPRARARADADAARLAAPPAAAAAADRAVRADRRARAPAADRRGARSARPTS